MKIKLSAPTAEQLLRQTPGGRGAWGEAQFICGDSREAFDAWVVYERLAAPETALCDPDRVILLTGEPPAVRSYCKPFVSQFAAVAGANDRLDHPKNILRPPAIPWWAGVAVEYPRKLKCNLDYDAFVSRPAEPKSRRLSLITTRKTLTAEHRLRLAFVERLQAELGDELEIFGDGFRPIADKWEAIAPYQYHIVLENSSWPAYFTEKLADCYLGRAFPFYWGCPNLQDYFPAGAFRWIDRDKPKEAVRIVRETMAAGVHASAAAEIERARNLVLNQYNLFPAALKVIRALPAGEKRRVRLTPEEDFTDPLQKVWKRKARRALHSMGMGRS